MEIVPKIDFNKINHQLKEYVQDTLDKEVLRKLNELGMECVSIAKSLNTYKDQTGNLRNSIGYIIQKNGVVIDSFFDSGIGSKKGNAYAIEVGSNFSEGYALIVVAGMEYAGYVEDVHNLDVLKPAENNARKKANRIMKDIIKSIKMR